MHVILICISVTIQLYSVLSVRRIIDLTSTCTHHGLETLYLTSGFGSFDGQTYIISTEKLIDCQIVIVSMEQNYILTVVEIPDWHAQHKLCFQENTTTITTWRMVVAKEVERLNLGAGSCALPEFKSTFACSIHSPWQLISHHSQPIPEPDMLCRYTWTKALRVEQVKPEFFIDPGLYKCRSQEIKCVFNRKVLCLSAEFICDGDDNCGVPNEYDEDFATCRGFGVTYFMIFCSLIMCVLSLLLLALLFLSFSPKRKETFVYRFDNLIPLFDSETGVINYEIDIKVLFPPASKSLPSTKPILLNK